MREPVKGIVSEVKVQREQRTSVCPGPLEVVNLMKGQSDVDRRVDLSVIFIVSNQGRQSLEELGIYGSRVDPEGENSAGCTLCGDMHDVQLGP